MLTRTRLLLFGETALTSALFWLTGEPQGLAIAGDASGVAVAIKDTTTPANNRSNIDINDPTSPIVNSGTSPKLVLNAAGVLVWTAHNLLSQSNAQDNAAWTKSGFTVSAVRVLAADGSLTANQMFETSGNSPHQIYEAFASVAGATYTWMVEAKTNGAPWIKVEDGNGGHGTFFDLVNGVVGSTTSGSVASIVSLGGGWYRCITSRVASAGTNYLQLELSSDGSTLPYAGDITKGVYIAKTQVNYGTVPAAYRVTTSAAWYAVPTEFDLVTRKFYALSEPAATNLLLNNAALSTQDVTVAAVANTLSFFGTGTVTLTGVSTAGPLVGTGASNRVSLTFTPTAGTLHVTVTGSVTNAQLEVGSVATSVIPTYAATVTRAADNINAATSAFPIGSSYSMLIEAQTPNLSVTTGMVSLSASGNEEAELLYGVGSQLRMYTVNLGATQANLLIGSATINTTFKVAGRFAVNDFHGAANGTLSGAPDTSGTMPITPTLLKLAGDRGDPGVFLKIYNVVIVPRAYSNAELQAKTT